MLTALLLSSALATEALPVHRIRFYETGVAWFERRGQVSGDAELPVPTSHLDDALKSLVVLGGTVDLDAITFPSAEAGDAARVNAGLVADEPLGYREALQALVGEQVDVTTDRITTRGLLLDVEGPLPRATPTDIDAALLLPHFALTLLAADGSVQRRVTEGVATVKATDSAVTARLAQAAKSRMAHRAARPKGLGLQLHRHGELALGYVAEAPVWRVSYRLHEVDDDQATLSGWALVHNTTDEDWRGVRVELANGEPDSFLYPLAAPRYADRELRTPDRQLATVAQLAQGTVDEMWKVERGLSVSSGSGGLGSRGYGMGGGGSALGMAGQGTVSTTGRRGKTAPPVETPSQFVYVVDRRVDLPARHSALVPMLGEDVHAESVVVFGAGSTQARTGVWLVNDTKRTLPAGVLTVVRQKGLEGEAQLQRLKPTETQMVTIGRELDVALRHTSERLPEADADLRYEGGQVRVDRVSATQHRFEVRNRSGRRRDVWVGLSITGDVRQDRRTELDRHTGDTYVVVEAPAGSHDDEVTVDLRTTKRLAPADVTTAQWEAWREAGVADDEVLSDLVDLASDRDRLDERLAEVTASRARAEEQLQGLRQSLAAAESDAGPLTRQAGAVEKEVRRLAERQAELQGVRAEADRAVVRRLREAWPEEASG